MGYIEQYKKMSDEELVLRYHNGDDGAAEFLVEKYKNLVRKESRAYFLVGGDNEDLLQEGMIGLYKAIRDYEAEKNVGFMSFASLCISRQIKTAVTKSQRMKNTPLNNYLSFDTPVTDEQGEDAVLLDVLPSTEEKNPENLLIAKEQYTQLFEEVYESLSKMENEVLECFMQGLSYSEIGKLLNKSPKAIDNAMQRIRNKINTIRKNG